MRRAGLLMIACAAVALGAGCFRTLGGAEAGPSIKALGKVHQGVTTPADLVALFGRPTLTVRTDPHTETFVYDYPDKKGGGEVSQFSYVFVDGVLDHFTIQQPKPSGPSGEVVAPGADGL